MPSVRQNSRFHCSQLKLIRTNQIRIPEYARPLIETVLPIIHLKNEAKFYVAQTPLTYFVDAEAKEILTGIVPFVATCVSVKSHINQKIACHMVRGMNEEERRAVLLRDILTSSGLLHRTKMNVNILGLVWVKLLGNDDTKRLLAAADIRNKADVIRMTEYSPNALFPSRQEAQMASDSVATDAKEQLEELFSGKEDSNGSH